MHVSEIHTSTPSSVGIRRSRNDINTNLSSSVISTPNSEVYRTDIYKFLEFGDPRKKYRRATSRSSSDFRSSSKGIIRIYWVVGGPGKTRVRVHRVLEEFSEEEFSEEEFSEVQSRHKCRKYKCEYIVFSRNYRRCREDTNTSTLRSGGVLGGGVLGGGVLGGGVLGDPKKTQVRAHRVLQEFSEEEFSDVRRKRVPDRKVQKCEHTEFRRSSRRRSSRRSEEHTNTSTPNSGGILEEEFSEEEFSKIRRTHKYEHTKFGRDSRGGVFGGGILEGVFGDPEKTRMRSYWVLGWSRDIFDEILNWPLLSLSTCSECILVKIFCFFLFDAF